MKAKNIRKLRLSRETLQTLTSMELRTLGGAGSENTCDTCLLYQTGPCFPCMTNEFYTCDTCQNC